MHNVSHKKSIIIECKMKIMKEMCVMVSSSVSNMAERMFFPIIFHRNVQFL